MRHTRFVIPKRDVRVGYFGAALPQWLRVLSDPPPKLPEEDWPWIEHIRMTGQLGSGACNCWYNPQPYESDEPLPLNKNVAEREASIRAISERTEARRRKLKDQADKIRLIKAGEALARRKKEQELARQIAAEARKREAELARERAVTARINEHVEEILRPRPTAEEHKAQHEEDKQEQIRLATELAARDKALVEELAERRRLEAAAAQTLRDAAFKEQARRDAEWAAARPKSRLEAMFPGWDDAEMQLIRFIQQGAEDNWVVEINADGAPAIALSSAHICVDFFGRRFRGGLVVPPSNWMQFLAQYREGLKQYFDFTQPRPGRLGIAEEREVYRLQLLGCIRERERQVVAQGGLRAKRNLAHALGVDHQIVWLR
jgi:hypothetical protein